MSYSKTYQKILVVATHCIGDSLLISAFTRSLREAYPSAIIDVLVNARGEMVFGTNPDINELVEIPQRPKLNDYIKVLKRGRYDLVVNEMLNDRTAIYSFLFGRSRLGAVDESLPGAWLKKFIFDLRIIEQDRFEHKMSRAARMMSKIGVTLVPGLISPEEPLPHVVSSRLPEQYIVIHAPSSNEIKQWPVEYWIELIQDLLKLGYQIVLTGAPVPRDEMIVKEILDKIPSSSNLHCVLGELSLAQTSTLLKHSMGFVGPDSGPGHMASGYPIPIVSIISVAPASMWAPWPYRHPVDVTSNLYDNGLKSQEVGNVHLVQSERRCVPCYANKCKISDDFYSPCLQDITPDAVVGAVKSMIPLQENK
ncbi:glycosyltransferase family 9 protein [Vibrio paucivorans]